jgi:hypothetical protein
MRVEARLQLIFEQLAGRREASVVTPQLEQQLQQTAVLLLF